jgi:protein disulfide-isomerase A1
MKNIFFILLSCLLVAFADSDVLELEDSNIEEAIGNNEHIFIEFYAPWCGHCKRLAPDYDLVAAYFKGEGKVVIAKIDASTHTTAAGTHGVRGFPTLKLFSNGVAKDYEGERTSMAMIQWIKKKTGPATKHITSAEEREALFAEPSIKVVAHFAEGSESENTWTQVSKSGKLEDFELAHITDDTLFNGQNKDSVVIFRFEEDPVVFTGEFTQDAITAWVLSEGYPLIDELAQKTWTRSSTSQQPLLALFVTDYSEENFNFAKEVARNFKGKVITTYSNSAQLAERWGSSGKVIPTAIYVHWAGEQPKFVIYNEESSPLTAETAISFTNQAIEGTYTSYKKSEPIPESNDDAVKVLVGKNFEEIVFDKEKDVFVEFYAPWCGHCKKLAPVWDELGEVFEDKAPNVVIAKIDATANSLPDGIEIGGFPTLIFFPADDKKGVPYNADRDLESLRQFVIDHASRPITEKEDL